MGQRPAHVKPPAYLSKSPPVPQPADPQASSGTTPSPEEADGKPDPVRFGDWERKGIAVDF